MKPYNQYIYPIQIKQNVVLSPLGDSEPKEYYSFLDGNRLRIQRFDPHAARHENITDVQQVLANIRTLALQNQNISAAIWEADKIIGYVTCIVYADKSVELGFAVDHNHEGKGIVTAAVTALLKAASSIGVTSALLRCSTDNLRSISIAQKLGFEQEGGILPPNLSQHIPHEHFKYVLSNFNNLA